MTILGISAFYHDSAAAIIQDGEIIAAAQEERFSRKKNDAAFPTEAIQYCLSAANVRLSDLDAVVFYDKPLLKFERLLETYYGFAPKGIASFIKSIPVWLREKMFIKDLIYKSLKDIQPFDKKDFKLLFPEHHLSHAASAFYPSPFEEAAILTIDGVGEWATASISKGSGKDITLLKELRFPHSLGLLYSAFTYFLGFEVNGGEYKLMGLAPYGNPDAEEVQRFIQLIKTKLIEIKPDGSLWLDQSYFNYATGLRMVKDKKWTQLFGFPRRATDAELTQQHCNLGLAIQQVTEEVVLLLAKTAQKLTGCENLCLAGGVALNCVANGKLEKAAIFKNIFIQPAAGDSGGALGAALVAHHVYFEKERKTEAQDKMKGSYLGPEFATVEIEKALRPFKAVVHFFENTTELCAKTAELLATGAAIGWMQGRMEFGPRALGARSILGDARDAEMQKKLNLKIKYRESFRPFAPSVLAADAAQYFELLGDSPYMLLVHPIQKNIRLPLPSNYQTLGLQEKLYVQRSSIPAVTHIDFSARLQTVHQATNPKYWQLLTAFKALTGCSLLINTSFNVKDEPIVCTPEDAYRCFMKTEMDYLVIGNFLLKKEEQPEGDRFADRR